MAVPNEFLNRYNAIRNGLVAKVSDPQQRAYVLARFDSDPRVQQLRKSAGLTPVSTVQGEVKQVAKKGLAARIAGGVSDFLGAMESGGEKALFGIPTRLTAAADYYLPQDKPDFGPSVPRGKTYAEQLAIERKINDQASSRSSAGDIIGQLFGGGVGIHLAGKAIGAGAARLAATEAPLLAQTGNILQNLSTLRKGQIVRNAGRAAVAGGAVGAAQAAGEGNDIGTGAEIGAATAGGLQGAGSLVGKFLLRPAADILGISNAGQYLRRFTSATVDEIKQNITDFRAKTGAEPTLFQVLPLQDRNNLIKNVVAGRDPIVEQASNAIPERVANVQPEMKDVVNSATQKQRLLTQRQMVGDLAGANGGKSAPGDAAMALRASQSPTDMLSLRREESRRIMAPHDSSQVVANANDLIPQYPVTDANGTVRMKEANPEISRVIRAVSGGLSLRPNNAGINVREITDMVSQLREAASEGNVVDRSAAKAAADHLMDVMDQNVPEAADATQQMRTAFAAHSRMAEGLDEGLQSRMRDEIRVGTSNSRAQGVTNAYDTNEGVAGRQLGQTNALTSDLGRSPESAVRATVDLARNGNPAIAENLGQDAADQIQTAAQAQAQGVENLSSALARAKGGEGNAISSEDLTKGLLALSPHTFVGTKYRFLHDLMSGTFMPDAKARVLTDMMFSQDPRLIDRAAGLLNQTTQGRALQTGLLASLTAANTATAETAPDPSLAAQDGNLTPINAPEEATPAAQAPQGGDDPYASIAAPAQAPTGGDDPYASIGSTAPGQPADSPYSGKLAATYQNENPDLVALVQRQKQQESGGDQSKVSKKGAVGVMQVTPKTAPEAAKYAGVPWDPQAYHSDGTYNEILGHAYISHLLTKYGGDVPRALAAYNAGPDKVDKAVTTHGENFLSALPAETQDYVAKVGG